MYSIAYTSVAAPTVCDQAVSRLCTQSQAYNKARGISGFLALNFQMFFQYLEGPEAELVGLLQRIRTDQRHTLIHTLHLGALNAPRFADWYMEPAQDLASASATAGWLITDLEEAMLRHRSNCLEPAAVLARIQCTLDELAAHVRAGRRPELAAAVTETAYSAFDRGADSRTVSQHLPA